MQSQPSWLVNNLHFKPLRQPKRMMFHLQNQVKQILSVASTLRDPSRCPQGFSHRQRKGNGILRGTEGRFSKVNRWERPRGRGLRTPNLISQELHQDGGAREAHSAHAQAPWRRALLSGEATQAPLRRCPARVSGVRHGRALQRPPP